MAEEPGGRGDEIGIEPGAPPRVRSLPTRTETGGVPRAIAILFALVAYVVLAYGVYDRSLIGLQDDVYTDAAMEAERWSGMLLFGGLLGLPGVMIAAGLMAPRERVAAPFVGMVLGLAHYALGYAILIVFHRWADALALPAGFVYCGLGWAWVLPLRRRKSR